MKQLLEGIMIISYYHNAIKIFVFTVFLFFSKKLMVDIYKLK